MLSDFFSLKVVVSGWIDVWSSVVVFQKSTFPVFCGLHAVSASRLQSLSWAQPVRSTRTPRLRSCACVWCILDPNQTAQ